MPEWWTTLYPATTEKLTKKWFFGDGSEDFTEEESELYHSLVDNESKEDESDKEHSFRSFCSDENWQMIRGTTTTPMDLAKEGKSEIHSDLNWRQPDGATGAY